MGTVEPIRSIEDLRNVILQKAELLISELS